jgi:hypothetical protein
VKIENENVRKKIGRKQKSEDGKIERRRKMAVSTVQQVCTCLFWIL